MTNYLKNKFVLVVGLVAASYFAGLNKTPSFQERPARAQQAIVEQHQDAEALLTQAVSEYKRGNSKKAEELYWQFKKEAAPLKRIDPHYEELETRLFRYSAAIIDTVDIVTKHINPLYEKIMVGTPERIAEYVTTSNFQGLDNHLEIIGPESGAYHRLDGDEAVQITKRLEWAIVSSIIEVKGKVANTGKVKGKVRIIDVDYGNFEKVNRQMEEMQQGEILVAETTAPEIIQACKKAAAIVTNQGGTLSHAAIVSRELNVPCIIGADKDVLLSIKTGDEIEVDANKGVVRILNKKND